MRQANIATSTMTRAERIAVWTLLAAATALHGVFAFWYRVDSDEPQHLHVVWGWAHGLLQYRDVFDNHTPLFQILMAPAAWCLGDRADLLFLMRLAILPIIAAGVACVWWIGRSVFGPRVGAWAAVMAALLPPLFLGEGEFRTDTLWTTCWLATLAILCGSKLTFRRGPVLGDADVPPASSPFPDVSSSSSAKQQQQKQDAGKMPAAHADGTPASLTFRRGLLAGLALGATFSVSLKSTYLLLGLAGAGLLTAAMSAAFFSWKQTTRGAGRFLLAMLIGWLLLPSAIVTFFWFQGAGGDMYYGVIGHNMLPLERSISWPLTALAGLACVALAFAVGIWVLKFGCGEGVSPSCVAGVPPASLASSSSEQQQDRAGTALEHMGKMPMPREDAGETPATQVYLGQAFLVLLGGTSMASLLLWPLISAQDYLPLYPIWMILGVAFVDRFLSSIRWFARWGLANRLTHGAISPLVFAVLAVAGIVTIAVTPAGDSRPSFHLAIWRDVLRLTDPGQVVMDLKGELIFRPRAYRYVVETLTGKMFQRGLLPAGDVQKSMIDRGACVASRSVQRLPEQARRFMEQNYLPVGTLLAVGKTLQADDSGNVDFDVVIETRYVILTSGGFARGQLDGQAYSGPVKLAPGRHRYKPADGEDKLALIWAQAVERGYYPPGFVRSPN